MPSTRSRLAQWSVPFVFLFAASCTNGPLAEPLLQQQADPVAQPDGGAADPGDTDDLGPDFDQDGVPNAEDNCPTTDNNGQGDSDQDGVGDACDFCPSVPDPEQEDADDDGKGDACEPLCPDGDDLCL
jgi:hypothetical protein